VGVMTNSHILAVDDDPAIRELIIDYLSDNDLRVTGAANGQEMLSVLDRDHVDLVVLDVKMPGEDGFSLARGIRAKSQVPIIMLTGQSHEVDRVLGLELGADDYLTKPFSPRELLARIRAVLRRYEPAASSDAVRRESDIKTYHRMVARWI
jgi:two-component system, OmpR family, response regulator